MFPRPAGEGGGDDDVELFVGVTERPGDPCLDLAEDHRVDGRPEGREVTPVGQQHPLRGRVEAARPGEEVGPRLGGHPVVGDDQGDESSCVPELLEPVDRVGRGRFGDGVVVVAVAVVDRLVKDGPRRVVVVDEEDDGELLVGRGTHAGDRRDRVNAHAEDARYCVTANGSLIPGGS